MQKIKALKDGAKMARSAGSISESELVTALATMEKDYPEGIQAHGTDALRFGLCSYDIKSELMHVRVTV